MALPFKILVNNHKHDRFLTANKLLEERIKKIQKKNIKDKKANCLPTLAQLEETHIFFLKSQFKPFASIAYEYNTVNPKPDSVKFGHELIINIPVYGDFINDIVAHVTLTGLEAADLTTYDPIPPNNPIVPQTTDQVRYCNYLGHRLFKKTSFNVNGNTYDSYSSFASTIHRQFYTKNGTRSAYDRMIGQNVEYSADLYHNPGTSEEAQRVNIVSGPQTWRKRHEKVELYIPLLFWFCNDVSRALPSLAIPYSHTNISINIADVKDICEARAWRPDRTASFINPKIELELIINNIFVSPLLVEIFMKRVGFILVRTHQESTYQEKGKEAVLDMKIQFPVETLFVAAQPLNHVSSHKLWDSWNYIEEDSIDVPVIYGSNIGRTSLFWAKTRPYIETLSLTSHGHYLYNIHTAGFYNSYMTTRFGFESANNGILCLNFALNPRDHQPSGYVNFSVLSSFETCVNFASDDDYILKIMARTLNFLIIKDGTAYLKYSS